MTRPYLKNELLCYASFQGCVCDKKHPSAVVVWLVVAQQPWDGLVIGQTTVVAVAIDVYMINFFNEVFSRAPLSTASTTPSCTLTMSNIWSDLFLSMEVFTFSKSAASTTSCTNRKRLKPLTSHLNHMTHTHCLILWMHIHMHANRPTLMTAPADTYVKNAASTLSILCGETLSQHLSESMRYMQYCSSTLVYTHIELQTYFFWWGKSWVDM